MVARHLGGEIVTEQDGAAQPEASNTELLTSVHLTGCISSSLSTDGTFCAVVFTVGDEKAQDGQRKFMVTFPAEHARFMANLMHDLRLAVDKRGVQQGQMVQHRPDQYHIGHSAQRHVDGVQGLTCVTFDLGQPAEYSFIMPNIAALQFGTLLMEGIKPNLTPQERELWRLQELKLRDDIRKSIKTRPGIIIPGIN